MRLTLVLLVAVSLVLPRATAAIAAMTPGQFGAFVICTPEGLLTVTLDADGAPVETGGGSDPCPLVHGLPGATVQAPTGWDRAPRATPRGRIPAVPDPADAPAPAHRPRAPPIV